MKAVILAAGRGTRMKELTKLVPKPMLTVRGENLLEHKVRALPKEIDEIIFIIGYQGDVIRSHFGDSYAGKKITYVVQSELNGTGGALWQAAPHLTGRFMVLMGDDLYGADDLALCANTDGWVVLVQPTDTMSSGGRVVLDERGGVLDITEGNHEGTAGLMNTNLFVLDESLFSQPLIPKAPGSDEYGLPQTVLAAARAQSITLNAHPATFWFQITAPEDIEKAEARLAELGLYEWTP